MILSSIVTQHAVEAADLWQLYQAMQYAPHYNSSELAKLAARREAHLDGLRIAAEEGWEIVVQLLEANQIAGEAYVATQLASECSGMERWNAIAATIVPSVASQAGASDALGTSSGTLAIKIMNACLTGTIPGQRRLGLLAYAKQQLNPGLALEQALHDTDVSLRAIASRITGEMGYAVWAKHLKTELRHPDLHCRFAAAWSLARLTGDPAALAELQTIALAESVHRVPAVNMLLRRLEPNAARKIITLLSRVNERLGFFAIGVWGDPVDVPYLLEKMKQTPFARIAGESFTFITGLNLAANNCDGPIPEDHEPMPNEDPLDDRVEMDPDENLPWPIVDKVQDWWNKNRTRFQPGTRYLVGEPLSETRCNKVVIEGYQRQRAYAALELAIKNPGQPILDITGSTK